MRVNPSVVETVKKLVQKVKVVYLATASREGLPHIAASEGMAVLDGNRVFFKAWFCLKTIENLRQNPNVCVAVLDPARQEGYQLVGELERIDQGAMLNGFAPEKEKEWAAYPQAEYQLLIQIKAVSHLTSGPHSDEMI